MKVSLFYYKHTITKVMLNFKQLYWYIPDYVMHFIGGFLFGQIVRWMY